MALHMARPSHRLLFFFASRRPNQLGLATEELNRRWYEANTGQVITDVQRHIRQFGDPLDGGAESSSIPPEAVMCCARILSPSSYLSFAQTQYAIHGQREKETLNEQCDDPLPPDTASHFHWHKG